MRCCFRDTYTVYLFSRLTKFFLLLHYNVNKPIIVHVHEQPWQLAVGATKYPSNGNGVSFVSKEMRLVSHATQPGLHTRHVFLVRLIHAHAFLSWPIFWDVAGRINTSTNHAERNVSRRNTTPNPEWMSQYNTTMADQVVVCVRVVLVYSK